MNKKFITLIFLVIFFAKGYPFELNWESSTFVNVGTGDFAPSLIMANRGGTITQSKGVYERVALFCPLEPKKRFSYSFAIDAYAQATSGISYSQWNYREKKLCMKSRRPAAVTLQQLYGMVKYRSVFLMAGMKEHDRTFLNNSLSSGDLTLSNNARPIPQIRVGFYDFVDIPFTNGWVQIIGDIAYGKFTDDKWNEDHFNYYNSFITTDVWFHYKRLYLRSKPSKRLSVTVGMQHAAQFGGYYRNFRKGECIGSHRDRVDFKTFIDMFVQKQFNDSHIVSEALNFRGNHLGSWDVSFRYRLRNNDEMSFYIMKPWEDGTGIGWQNGFDGVWGIAYKFSNQKYIKGALIEYLDFTNQAGPFLHEPTEAIPSNPTGADNYYNNFKFNSWANYGMAIGSPALKSTIYNTDGFLEFQDNALRGFHMGMEGEIVGIDWRMLLSWKESKGTHIYPRPKKIRSLSMMIGAGCKFPCVEGLSFNGQLGFDAGNLYSGCFGILLGVTYSGKIFSKNK